MLSCYTLWSLSWAICGVRRPWSQGCLAREALWSRGTWGGHGCPTTPGVGHQECQLARSLLADTNGGSPRQCAQWWVWWKCSRGPQQTHSGEVSERQAPGFSVSWTQPGHECEAGKVYVFWVCVTEINDVNHVARSGCLGMLGGRCLEKEIWDGKRGPSPGCSGSDACFSWVHAGSRHSTWGVSETTPFWGSHVVPDTWTLAGRDCGTWWPQGSFLGSPQQLYHQGRLVPERKMRITNGRGPWDLFQMS